MVQKGCDFIGIHISLSHLISLVLALAFIVFVIGGTLSTAAWQKAKLIKVASEATVGEIILFDPANHSTGTVQYWVDETQYRGEVSGLRRSDLGKTITVHFNPANPSQAYFGVRPDSLAQDLSGVAFAVFLCSLVAVISFVRSPNAVKIKAK